MTQHQDDHGRLSASGHGTDKADQALDLLLCPSGTALTAGGNYYPAKAMGVKCVAAGGRLGAVGVVAELVDGWSSRVALPRPFSYVRSAASARGRWSESQSAKSATGCGRR